MNRLLLMAACALVIAVNPVTASGISGQYLEARTCDVYVASCVANAEMNVAGKHAVLAWKVDKGAVDNVSLDGLSIVAVVAASDTLGLNQNGPAKAVLIVDGKADAKQRAALINLAEKQAGDLVKNVIAVQSAPIDLTVCQCKDGTCATMQAGQVARIETRCIDTHHDKSCGNETAYYPPLAKDAKAKAAVAINHSFTGKDFNETWQHAERRSAYVGSFEIK
ncbi:MAG TPA: DUF1326 domain-containing protein [Gemmataceae bacterium]|jgi:hypothetical protein|nr:DUF1326 domain-containing protein [Gemmataceae bacterium]